MAGLLKPFEIAEDDLAKLDATQLVQLIKFLVQADLQTAQLPVSAIEGTLRINISDGGEDIRVEWGGGPEATAFIPNRCTIFQCKAEKLTDAKLRAEPLLENKLALKPAVAEVVARGGAYVLATSKTNTVTPTRSSSRQPKRAAATRKMATKRSAAKKGKKQVGSKRKTSTKKKAAPKKIKKPDLIVPRLKQMVGLIRGSLIKYDDRANGTEIRVYGPPKLTDWVNAHPMIAIWVKQALGYASADFAFQTVESWSDYRVHSNELVRWDVLNENLKTIRKAVSSPGQVVRLLGHSGIGKSRLAFEALSATAGVATNDLTPIVAYARKFTSDVLSQVRDFIHNKRRVVVVVDDCPPDGHRLLSEEVHRQSSLLNLVSLDFDFEEPPSGDLQIVVDAAPEASIREIVKTLGFAGSGDDLERIVQFCSGFPRIAVLVSDALKQGAQHFADFRDSGHFVNMLVWGRAPPNPELMRCLRCLALFEAVGMVAPKRDEILWVAQHLLKLPPETLEANLQHFYDRKIVQKRGYSISVLPRPLAAQLAAIYWKNASEPEKQVVLAGHMPDALIGALCNRLPDLQYVEHAREIAKKLCEVSGPFGLAKALNTDIGARCLRKLAEIAPIEVIDTLTREFGPLSLKMLKDEVGPGRRFLVWTLDALSWEPSVFIDTMRVLLRFAASENESWSNNATGEFVQRFRVQLPGTSASLEQRLECLDALIQEAEASETNVIISALQNAIDARGHSRTIGSERHGTRVAYIDYRPKIWKEVFDYVRGCLRLLSKLSAISDENAASVRSAISSIDLGLVVAEAVFPDFERLVRRLRPLDDPWATLIEHLYWTIKNQLQGDELGGIREKVSKLFKELLPHTLEERIIFYVKLAPWRFSDDFGEDDLELDRNQARAAELGVECAGDIDTYRRVVGRLSRGDVRQGFAFGKSLFEQAEAQHEVLQVALDALASAKDDIPNPALVGGMLFAYGSNSREDFEALLVSVARDDALVRHLVYFASMHLSPNALGFIVEGLRSGRLQPQEAFLLGAGRVLEPLPTPSVVALISALRDRGAEGVYVALDLLGMYTHDDPSKFMALRREIDEVLRSETIFEQDSSRRTLADHHYETLAARLLDDEEYGEPLCDFLAAMFIDIAKRSSFGNNDLLRKLSALIFKKFPDRSLERLASYVEMSEKREAWILGHILGSPFSFSAKEEGPLFGIERDALIAACRRYPKHFAVLVAEIAPLFKFDGAARSWSPLGIALLEEFGNRKEVLDAINSNIYTGGWSGPTSSHLRSYVAPLEEASRHKIAKVRSWAQQQLAGLNRQIAKELKDEEEGAVRS
jgi:hypothetical protein